MILTPIEAGAGGETGPLNEAQRASYVTMQRSAFKLLRLVNDLLDLSRLEESRLRLELGRHDLVHQLGTLVEQIQVLAQRKAIALSYRPEVDQAPAWCDAERLERVFVNLLSNALKFTPEGGQVAVRLAPSGAGFEITVSDDGPGFPPEKAARLFERFYQVDMEGTRAHGGTGIGLALAKELVQLHGGTIGAASDGRRGATFTVWLPVGAEVAPAGDGQADAEPVLDWAAGLAARRDFRLLEVEEVAERRVVERDQDEEARAWSVVVVEDNPQIVKLVHTTLRRHFKVLAAGDGLKGLELVRRERPHLVMTDLMMPEIDGLELTRRLRADERTRHIPILMLTARGELDDRVKGLETGVSAYLTKPFAPRELVSAARHLVRAGEQTADLVLTQRMESIELVAAGLAHELNNPLNYVRNALHRVRQDAEQVVPLVRAARERPLEAAEVGAAGPRRRAHRRDAGGGRRRPQAHRRDRRAHEPLRPGRLPPRPGAPRRLGRAAHGGGGGPAGHRPPGGGGAGAGGERPAGVRGRGVPAGAHQPGAERHRGLAGGGRPGHRAGAAATTAGWSWRCATTAPASPPRCCRASSRPS